MPIITKVVAVLLLFMAIPFLFQGWDRVWLDVSVVVDGVRAGIPIVQALAVVTNTSFFFGAGYLAFGLLLVCASVLLWLA